MTCSHIVPFDFEGCAVRVLDRDGEPWFVLADVCRVLEIGNPSDAASRLDADEKATLDNIEGQPGRGAQQFTIINESGLYSLVLTSRKPSAKRFKKWVTAEVLPSIRKTGGYGSIDPVTLGLPDFRNPVAAAKAWIESEEGRVEAEKRLEAAKPKIEGFDRLSTSEGSLCITDAAKLLQVRPKDLFGWMQSHGWIYHRPGRAGYLPYQDRIKQGVLAYKVATVECADGTEKIVEAVRVTSKGLTNLAKNLSEELTS